MVGEKASGLGTGWCRLSRGTNTCSPLLCLCLIAPYKVPCSTNNLTSSSGRKDEQPNSTVLFSGGTDLFESLDAKHPVSLDRSHLSIGQCMVAQSMLRLSSLGQQHSQSLRSPESANASIVYMYSERHEPGTNTSHFSGFQGVEYHHYTGNRGPGCFRLRCQASHAGTSLCELHWVSSKRRGENSLAPVCNKLHGVGWTSTSHLFVYRDLIQRNTSICHSSSNHALPRQTCSVLNI